MLWPVIKQSCQVILTESFFILYNIQDTISLTNIITTNPEVPRLISSFSCLSNEILIWDPSMYDLVVGKTLNPEFTHSLDH